MSAGGARRGRRDNGLDASEYAVAGDVDPRVGEHLLDVLAAGGIAAYLQPSADLNPITRATTVPSRPVDRLYVDRSHLTTARDYLTQLADEAHAGALARRAGRRRRVGKIVAGFHTAPAGRSRPGRPGGRRRRADRPDHRPVARRPGPTSPTGRPATDVRRLPYAADISGISVNPRRRQRRAVAAGRPGHLRRRPAGRRRTRAYTPPPPPPLPQISKYAVLGVLAS